MDGGLLTAGIVGLITGLFAYATQRAASNAAVRSTELSSRTEVEKEAFGRAEDYYQGVIADQDRRYASLKIDLDDCNQGKARLRSKNAVLATEMDALGNDLANCKELLRRKS